MERKCGMRVLWWLVFLLVSAVLIAVGLTLIGGLGPPAASCKADRRGRPSSDARDFARPDVNR
jgi:hypothetical protein